MADNALRGILCVAVLSINETTMTSDEISSNSVSDVNETLPQRASVSKLRKTRENKTDSSGLPVMDFSLSGELRKHGRLGG